MHDVLKEKARRRTRRRKHIRKRIKGTPERPRLVVSRSHKHIYAQVIDDASAQTLAAASSVALKTYGGNRDAAAAVGKALAEKAKEANIERVCFDRAGRLYHGRVKALADAAREAGLQF
jgi:large subunit ribosomal protein L18